MLFTSLRLTLALSLWLLSILSLTGNSVSAHAHSTEILASDVPISTLPGSATSPIHLDAVGPFRFLEPSFNCSTGAFIFRALGQASTNFFQFGRTYYKAIGITDWNSNAGPFFINPACDAKSFTLQAYQEFEPTNIITYSWNYTATCPNKCFPENGSPQSSSSTSSSSFSLLAPDYDCTTGTFNFRSVGGDGSEVSYQAIGVTDWTSSTGPFTVKPACDVQPFIMMARQASKPEIIRTYFWNYTDQCPTPCPDRISTTRIEYCGQPYILDGRPLSLSAIIQCYAPASSAIIAIIPSGGFVEQFSVIETKVGNSVWQQSCTRAVPQNIAFSSGVFEVSVRIRNTNTNAIREQTTINVPSPCLPPTSLARVGSANRDSGSLTVTVLGNPTLDEVIDLDVQGAQPGPLQIQVSNPQGQPVQHQTFEQPTEGQSIRVQLGKSAGIYLLRVSTPTQQKVVKVVKQ